TRRQSSSTNTETLNRRTSAVVAAVSADSLAGSTPAALRTAHTTAKIRRICLSFPPCKTVSAEGAISNQSAIGRIRRGEPGASPQEFSSSVGLRITRNRIIVFTCKRRKPHSAQVVSGEWKKLAAL